MKNDEDKSYFRLVMECLYYRLMYGYYRTIHKLAKIYYSIIDSILNFLNNY